MMFSGSLDSRRGFTLVELLIVMVVIAILSSILLVTARMVGKTTKEKKTQGIVETLHSAIVAYNMQSGGQAMGSVPHPLLTFGGNAVDDTDGDSVLIDEDLLLDQRTPIIYGWEGARAGRLGVVTEELFTNLTEGLKTEYKLGFIANLNSWDTPAKNRKLLEFIFSHSDAQVELERQGALVDTTQPGNIVNDTLYSPDGPNPTGGGALVWGPEPSTIKIGALADSSAKWKQYKIRGLSIYDSWGNDIFYVYDRRQGRFSFVSPGKDGAMRIDPGKNLSFETTFLADDDPDGIALGGDDKWGRDDNIQSGELDQ